MTGDEFDLLEEDESHCSKSFDGRHDFRPEEDGDVSCCHCGSKNDTLAIGNELLRVKAEKVALLDYVLEMAEKSDLQAIGLSQRIGLPNQYNESNLGPKDRSFAERAIAWIGRRSR